MNQEREHYCEPTPPYNPRYRLVDMGETHALFPLVDDCHDETTAFPTTRFALLGAPAIHIVAFTEPLIAPRVQSNAKLNWQNGGRKEKRLHTGTLSLDVRCLQTDAEEGYKYAVGLPLFISHETGNFAAHFSSNPIQYRPRNPNASMLIWRCSMFQNLEANKREFDEGMGTNQIRLSNMRLTVPLEQAQRSKWTIRFGT